MEKMRSENWEKKDEVREQNPDKNRSVPLCFHRNRTSSFLCLPQGYNTLVQITSTFCATYLSFHEAVYQGPWIMKFSQSNYDYDYKIWERSLAYYQIGRDLGMWDIRIRSRESDRSNVLA